MENNKKTISACLVVYHEEKVIERCLKSIVGLVDEIIVVHDGPCTDNTLEIAKKYTDKIFVREHVGIMEAHLVFAFKKAIGDWIFRIDADEYVDEKDFSKIREAVNDQKNNALILQWEMWNGEKTIYFPGLQKMCLVRRDSFHYCGIPHENGSVDGHIQKMDIFLHHRPAYNNIAWSSFLRKTRQWVPIHARYFFPETTTFECFNATSDAWLDHSRKVRKHIWYYLLVDPLKMSLGQFKNGLWKSRYGIQVCLERFVYYVMLYSQIRKNKKESTKTK